MYARSTSRDAPQIDDEVPYGPETGIDMSKDTAQIGFACLTSCLCYRNIVHSRYTDRHLGRGVRKRCKDVVDILPMTAIPLKFGAANSVGGVLASPISCV